jgi:sporulation protein YlmC with PRC-barrel domain
MGTYKTEATTRPLGQLDSSHHLIESDRVEGTAVIDPKGVKIGTIERLMIDKLSGQVRYAVLASGGFLGLGESHHPLPWDVLNYNAEEGAYVVDLDRETLERAPHYLGRDEPDWSSRDYNVRIFEYYRVNFPPRSSARL